MPAYAKIALVTSVFHASDIAFVRGWSARAPGIDGWRVTYDKPDAPECVMIAPPGADGPVFFLSRRAAKTVLERRPPGRPDEELTEIGSYDTLRLAVQALCKLDGDALQEIHEQLERDFPRGRRR